MKRLREWRLRRFLTQKQLAEKLGVPYQNVQRWEAGAMPRPSRLRDLCRILEVAPEELLTTEELRGEAAA
jgi:transcriptional regulator with XRE-family HTH domain